MKEQTYIAIDLKSFYASVECQERGLDPMDTNLVVADESRTDKTICLAVTPSLKSYGISGRGRLFEVKQRVKEANAGRQHDAPGHRLNGTSHFFSELQANPSLAIDFHHCTAPDGVLHGVQHPHLSGLPQVHRAGGHRSLLHRRGVHGCDGLPEHLQTLGP